MSRLLNVLFVIGIVGAPERSLSQSRTVYGTITDSAARQVPGARVRRLDAQAHTLFAPAGRFALQIASDTTRLLVWALGFRPETVTVGTTTSVEEPARIVLHRLPPQLESIRVEESRALAHAMVLDGGRTRDIPAVGEPDILRALVTLPFVTQPTDLRGQVHLAAGAGDEVQYLLDGFPLQDPFHLQGILGAFNVGALDAAEVRIGATPLSHPARMSGTINLVTAADRTEGAGELGLGLVAASLTDHRARADGKLSTLFSGRATYLAPLLRSVIGVAGGASGDDVDGLLFEFRDVLGRVRARFSEKRELTLLGYGSTDRGASQTAARYSEVMFGTSLRELRGRTTLELTASHDVSTAAWGPRVAIRKAWSSVGVSGSMNTQRAMAKIGVRLDRRLHQLRWDQTDLFGSVWAGSVPRFVKGEQQLTSARAFAEGERQLPFGRLHLSVGAQSTPARLGWDASASLVAPLTRSIVLETSFGQRLQQDFAMGTMTDVGLPPPVFLLRDPRQAQYVTAALRRDWSTSTRSITGDWSLSLFGRRVARGPAFALLNESLSCDPEQVRTCAASSPDSNARKAFGGSTSLSARSSRLAASVSYSFQRSTERMKDGRTRPSVWDSPHVFSGQARLKVRRKLGVSAAVLLRSGLPTDAVTALVPVPLVFGVTDSVRFRIESSEARLPHYRRLDIGVQKDFSRWGMEGTFAFNVINATWRTNPVELDWSGYFCSRDPACRTRKIARRAGLPIIPTIGLSVRW